MYSDLHLPYDLQHFLQNHCHRLRLHCRLSLPHRSDRILHVWLQTAMRNHFSGKSFHHCLLPHLRYSTAHDSDCRIIHSPDPLLSYPAYLLPCTANLLHCLPRSIHIHIRSLLHIRWWSVRMSDNMQNQIWSEPDKLCSWHLSPGWYLLPG